MATLQQKINVAYNEAFGRNATAGELSYYGGKGDAGYGLLVDNLRKDTNAGGNFATWRQQQAAAKAPTTIASAPTTIASAPTTTASAPTTTASAPTTTASAPTLLDNIRKANPASIANKEFINALYKQTYGRDATASELQRFAGQTVASAAGTIMGNNSPWKGQGTLVSNDKATLINKKTGDRKAVYTGSSEESRLFNSGYVLDTGDNGVTSDSTTARNDANITDNSISDKVINDAKVETNKTKDFEFKWADNIPGMPKLPSTAFPQAPDMVDLWKSLMQSEGIKDLSTLLNNKLNELTAFEDSYDQGRYDIGQKLGPMELIRGERAELQEQYIRQKNSKTRVINALQRSLDSKNSTIEIMMNLTKDTWSMASEQWQNQFTNAMNFQQQWYNQMNDQRDYDRLISNDKADREFQEKQLENSIKTQQRNEASANLSTLVSAMISSDKGWDNISQEQKNQIHDLERQAGLPVGSTEAFGRSKPESKLLSTVPGTDSSGNDIVTFIYADKDGKPGMMVTKKTGGFTKQSGSSLTVGEKASNATRSYLQNSLGKAISGSALDAAVRLDDENPGFATWFSSQITGSPVNGWSVQDINEAYSEFTSNDSGISSTIQSIMDDRGVDEETAKWLYKEESKNN